ARRLSGLYLVALVLFRRRRRPTPTLSPYTTLFRSSATSTVGSTAVPAMNAPWRTNSPHWNLPVNRSMKKYWMVRTPRTYCSPTRSEEHTSEPSHVSISYAVFCLKKKKETHHDTD